MSCPAGKKAASGAPEAIRAPDGEPRGSFLNIGDFNHDGRADVALLGNEVLQIFHQKPGGGLAKPLRLIHGIKEPGLMLTADLNGDGRDDLTISTHEDQHGMYVYLQDHSGALSAARRIKIPRLRSVTFAQADGGDDLFAIENTTGHLKHYRWEVKPDTAGTPDWPQRRYSYPLKLESRRLPFALGDLTGDGLLDCVCAAPDAAQLILYPGTPDGLGAGRPFPGLLKTVDLQVADLDGDGRNELLSVSSDEKTLGVSRFEDGRLTFPKPMTIEGQPLALTVGRLEEDSEKVCLAYIARAPVTKQTEEDDEEYEEDEEDARVLIHLHDPASGQELLTWDIGELDDDPSGLRLADVNQDGRNDLLLFVRYSALQTYLQGEDGRFTALTGGAARSSLVSKAKIEAFCLTDVTSDGIPEVLLAQHGLARALVVREGRWTVIDQYNPETAGAEITGLAALPGTPGSPLLVMYDRRAQELLVLKRRDDGTYAVTHTMPVGNFDLSTMSVMPIGPDNRPALLLADTNKLALFTPGEIAPTLVEQHSYETDVKDAWLGDAVVGDLNHDGVRDISLIDMRKAYIEVLTTIPGGELIRALKFQVFQGKRFSDEPDQYGEPHAVLSGDVSGDGIDDIVLLAHDRLIIYPGQ